MEIKFENIIFKIKEDYVFNNLNLVIPCKKIIGLYGNNYCHFIDLLIKKDMENGKIIDNSVLDNISVIDDYDHFITNLVLDEFYLNLKYNQDIEKEIVNILKRFNLELNFFHRSIDTLSSCEKKIVKLITAMFSSDNVLIFINLFNGLDYHMKKEFIKIIKLMKNKYSKTIFIHDNDMDIIDKLVDKLLVVDDNLIAIDKLEKIFMMDEIKKVKIVYPNFVKLKLMLIDKGIDVKNINNINNLIKEVKNNG